MCSKPTNLAQKKKKENRHRIVREFSKFGKSILGMDNIASPALTSKLTNFYFLKGQIL